MNPVLRRILIVIDTLALGTCMLWWYHTKGWEPPVVGLILFAGLLKLIVHKSAEDEYDNPFEPEEFDLEPDSFDISNEELDELKKSTKILFVDDDTKFKIVKILNKTGWSTKITKDIDDLDSQTVLESDILFIDIHGVGVKLDFKDEGLGLALGLKKKHPDKKVVIYSTESTGDRFHEALRTVDSFLSKNAEPYEFIELIEQLSADLLYE